MDQSTSRCSIAICCRDPLLRDGLSLILAQGFRVLASVGASNDAVLSSVLEQVSILLCCDDVDMSGIKTIRADHPSVRIVVVMSSSDDREELISGSDLDGILLSSISGEVLVASLQLVAMGSRVFSHSVRAEPSVAKRTLEDGPAEQPSEAAMVTAAHQMEADEARHSMIASRLELSERDLQVLAYLVAGDSNGAISRASGVKEATVKVHVKAIMRKIGVTNRTQAAVWAMKNEAVQQVLGRQAAGNGRSRVTERDSGAPGSYGS